MMRSISALLVVAALAAMPTFAGTPQTVVLDVKNMTCALCPITVRKSLEQVRGVATANVNLGQKTATVTFDPDSTTPAVLIRATTDAGFPSTVRK